MTKLPHCLAWLTAMIGLAGCVQPPAVATGPAAAPAARRAQVSATATAALPVPCPHVVATLTTGLVVHYDGAKPADPDICVVRWRGDTHRYYLGFWGDGQSYDGGADERRAVRTALTGPVGTHVDYAAHGAKLWSGVTVTHVADPVLIIDGQPRPTVELRRVLHDALGRADVQAEALLWVDRRTGITLRQQAITHMADGGRMAETIWQVEALHPANPRPG
jgi:hypothetical protein